MSMLSAFLQKGPASVECHGDMTSSGLSLWQRAVFALELGCTAFQIVASTAALANPPEIIIDDPRPEVQIEQVMETPPAPDGPIAKTTTWHDAENGETNYIVYVNASKSGTDPRIFQDAVKAQTGHAIPETFAKEVLEGAKEGMYATRPDGDMNLCLVVNADGVTYPPPSTNSMEVFARDDIDRAVGEISDGDRLQFFHDHETSHCHDKVGVPALATSDDQDDRIVARAEAERYADSRASAKEVLEGSPLAPRYMSAARTVDAMTRGAEVTRDYLGDDRFWQSHNSGIYNTGPAIDRAIEHAESLPDGYFASLDQQDQDALLDAIARTSVEETHLTYTDLRGLSYYAAKQGVAYAGINDQNLAEKINDRFEGMGVTPILKMVETYKTILSDAENAPPLSGIWNGRTMVSAAPAHPVTAAAAPGGAVLGAVQDRLTAWRHGPAPAIAADIERVQQAAVLLPKNTVRRIGPIADTVVLEMPSTLAVWRTARSPVATPQETAASTQKPH